ncbi:hypothetical protein EDD85DRAFT_996507 [Armillaria nabsnona]|nr:hypothetical protein EDD85DRAFT_996507 [Armillaria nabsnona]
MPTGPLLMRCWNTPQHQDAVQISLGVARRFADGRNQDWPNSGLVMSLANAIDQVAGVSSEARMKGDRVPRINRKSIMSRRTITATGLYGRKRVEDWYILHSEVAAFQPIVSVAWASYNGVRLSDLYPSSVAIIRNSSSFVSSSEQRSVAQIWCLSQLTDVNGSLVMDEVSKAVAQESLEMIKEEKRALDQRVELARRSRRIKDSRVVEAEQGQRRTQASHYDWNLDEVDSMAMDFGRTSLYGGSDAVREKKVALASTLKDLASRGRQVQAPAEGNDYRDIVPPPFAMANSQQLGLELGMLGFRLSPSLPSLANARVLLDDPFLPFHDSIVAVDMRDVVFKLMVFEGWSTAGVGRCSPRVGVGVKGTYGRDYACSNISTKMRLGHELQLGGALGRRQCRWRTKSHQLPRPPNVPAISSITLVAKIFDLAYMNTNPAHLPTLSPSSAYACPSLSPPSRCLASMATS